MPFLSLNGTTVAIQSNAAGEKWNEHGVDRFRTFDGAMRVTKRGDFRQWDLTSKLLTSAEASSLIDILLSASLPLAMAGDLCGADCAVMPVLVSNDPIQTASGFKRRVVFTLHETPQTLPPDTTAEPLIVLLPGIGMWSDEDRLVPSADGDRVWFWDDQSGNDNHVFAGDGTLRPTRDGLAVRFGAGPDLGGAASLQLGDSLLNSYSAAEIMACVKVTTVPPGSDARAVLWDFPTGGAHSDSGPTLFPATTGDVAENFCHDGSRRRFDPVVDLSDAYYVYNTGIDASLRFSKIGNAHLYTPEAPENIDFAGLGTCRIGNSAGGDWGDFLITKLVLNPAIFTTRQRESWFDYISGAVDDPPLP